MLRFYLQKLINNLVSLFIFLTLVFFFVQVMIPHNFTTQFAMGMNREQRAQMEEELGLDLPLYQQYLNWLGQIIRGDLGESFYGTGISGILRSELPMTLMVFFTGALIAFLIGQWLGKLTAWKGPGLLTGTTTFFVVALYTIFPPWLGFLLGFLLIEKLHLLPRRNPQGLFYDVVKSFPDGFAFSIPQIMTRMVLGLGVMVVCGVNQLHCEALDQKAYPGPCAGDPRFRWMGDHLVPVWDWSDRLGNLKAGWNSNPGFHTAQPGGVDAGHADFHAGYPDRGVYPDSQGERSWRANGP